MADGKKVLSEALRSAGGVPSSGKYEKEGGSHQIVQIKGVSPVRSVASIRVVTHEGVSHEANIGKGGSIGKVETKDVRGEQAEYKSYQAGQVARSGSPSDAAKAHAEAAEAHQKAGNADKAEQHRQASQDHAAKAAGGSDDRNRDDHGRFA